MTLRKWLPLFLLPAAALLGAVADGIEFSAVLVLPGKTSVRLALKSNGNAAWIPLGQSFDGYVVSAYDSKEETVVLTKNDVTIRVRLNTAKVQEGKPPLDPAVAEQHRRAMLSNLRQIAAAADQYFLEHGTNRTTLAEIVGPTKYIKALNPVDGEDYSQLVLTQGSPGFTVTTVNGVSVTYKP